VALPNSVHKVISRGREYFYFQAGRGTAHEGPRVRLPNDPHIPEFWEAIRTAQGLPSASKDTINALIDLYLASPSFTGRSESTRYLYLSMIKIVRAAWGPLSVSALQPHHVQKMMDGFASVPGKANNFLVIMKVLQKFGRPRNLMPHSVTEGVKPYAMNGGHKPWTPEQLRAADKLPGTIRRGFMLYNYTGQRGSDVVRLGWTSVDEGGFSLTQRKTGRPVWCPILPELSAEMATWEKRPGPFLLQASGRPYTRKLFWEHFDLARRKIPELADVTLHGLRCTAVNRLRRGGLEVPVIGDITGMSLGTIARYCRFADRKTSGQAALGRLTKRTPDEQIL
jgi:hypothetical protein